MKSGLYTTGMTAADLKKMLSSIDKLGAEVVLVGVPAEHNAHTSDDGKTITNSQIGYMNEFGVPEMNIPARPHLLPGIKAVEPRIQHYLAQAGQAALDGDSARVTRALSAAGQTAVSSVQRKITAGPFTPLADRTIENRLARGRTGTKPLIDTGQYRRAITYVIRKGKKS